jgi:hypothetical protein
MARMMERQNEPEKSPVRCCPKRASNQTKENPRIGKVRPPVGPWKDRM